jgi:transcriptional regulator with XRE-family HTH domain
MDNRQEIRDFLAGRRAKITPEQAGLLAYGGHRRVPGLRREEAAMLAGVSVDYYTRLERGALHGASESVLESLASALHLDDAERAHLFDVATASSICWMAGRMRCETGRRLRAGAGPAARAWPDHASLQRRARLTQRRCPQPARQLGRHRRCRASAGDPADPRLSVQRTVFPADRTEPLRPAYQSKVTSEEPRS